MLKRFSFLSFSVSVLLLSACQAPGSLSSAPGGDGISEASYLEHVTALAADEMEGRKPFTAGEQKTLAYLEQQAKALGLEPGNGNSYRQEVPLMQITTDAAPTMTAKGKESFELKGQEDYVLWARRTDAQISLQNTPLVFAGFGIVAPEYNWNDYAGLDVKGKIVLVLVNDPGFYSPDTTFFKGKTMTYYGRWTYKMEEAARQGAKGCIIVHATDAAGYPFQVVQNSWNTAKLYLDPRGKNAYTTAVEGWITSDVAEKLFMAAGKDYAAEKKRAGQRGFKPFGLGVTVSTNLKATVKYDKSYNFIAQIRGSQRPDEVLVYSAHWDHLGIGKKNAQNDSIYNGAADNASGTAGLLVLAKAFKSRGERPLRTVVFLAVTAEEQGLLGSKYYAENPVFSPAKTVANLNVDMLNPYGATRDMVVIGRGQSELEDLLAEEAAKAGRYLSNDPSPAAGLYFRSDHFNFAKVGVPALFITMGIDHIQLGKAEGKKLMENFTANHYHQLSDEVNKNFKTDGAVADLQLLYQLGTKLVNSAVWPQWKAGSEFKSIREKSKP